VGFANGAGFDAGTPADNSSDTQAMSNMQRC
jgi:hypothetical protein